MSLKKKPEDSIFVLILKQYKSKITKIESIRIKSNQTVVNFFIPSPYITMNLLRVEESKKERATQQFSMLL